MLSETQIERILLAALSRGGDFSEIYIEKSSGSGISMINGKLEKSSSGMDFGVGIRILEGTKCVYVYSNSLDEDTLVRMALDASSSLRSVPVGLSVILTPRQSFVSNPRCSADETDKSRKIELLRRATAAASEYHSSISQTVTGFSDGKKSVWVANSEGLYRSDERSCARFVVEAIASSATEKQSGYFGPGAGGGFSFFEDYPVEETARKAADVAVTMLSAAECPSGRMPVVIENGFGGVIFHEACAHALEATSVGVGASVFTDKLNQRIASDIVTAYDDGTIPNAWGSLLMDDEGEDTVKNLLIENGVLKGYMIDRLGSRRMGMPATGSSRRSSYQYAPTSRMTNTFIAAGKDVPADIIRDTEYGLYAKNMGGGSVDPATGEFNFAVNEAYLIRNGEIAEPVRGATLIGKGAEILTEIDRVGNNPALAQGMCGSSSGSIRVNVGQPTIRVKEITVGGRSSDEG